MNEINEKIKLDLVLYKYQIDSSKVENSLDTLPEKTLVDSIPTIKDKSSKLGAKKENKDLPTPETGKKLKIEGKKED